LQAHEVDLLRSLGDMVMMELELRRRTSLQQTLCSLPSSLRVRKALQRLSHELRTPLHCISGSMELVLDMGDLSASARECAQVCGGKGEGDLLGVLGGVLFFCWILFQGCTPQAQ
jgi:signal transduction histidine kinase